MDPDDKKTTKTTIAGDQTIMQLLVRYLKLVALMLIVWILGYFDLSASWVLLGVFVYLWNDTFQKKKLVQQTITQQAAKNEKEVILARVEDLPSWVYFPDIERAEWLNKIMSQMWPFIGGYVEDYLRDNVQQTIQDAMPPSLKSFKFEKIDMGDQAPRIGGIKVYTEHVRRDEIVMDMELVHASDADIRVKVKGFEAGIKDLQVRGTLRIEMKPLIDVMPLLGGVTVFFLNKPMIDFNLTNLANALDVPGLSDILHKAIMEKVSGMMVLPNRFSIPLAKNVDVLKLKYPQPQGVLRIHMVGAKDLKKADINLFGKGKSDPYVKLIVGAKSFKTKVINNSLNPTWNEFFEVVIDQRDGQVLELKCYDEDPGSKDDKLGICTVDIASVAEKGHMDSWIPLENIETGMLHVRLTWLNLSPDPADLAKALEQCTLAWSEDHLSAAILMVTVDSCSNLPAVHTKAMMEPHPGVTLTIGNDKQSTTIKKNTDQPVFEEYFKFLIHNPDVQELDVQVTDNKTGKSLGFITIPLKDIMAEEDLTKSAPYMLKGSGPLSKITLRMCLRILASGVATEVIEDENYLLEMNKQNATSTPKKDEHQEDQTKPDQNGTDPVTFTLGSAKPGADSDYSPSSTASGGVRRRFSQQSETSRSSAVGGEAGLGKIQITIRYSTQRNRLVVVVHKAVKLIPCDDNNLADPYVRLYLLPDRYTHQKKKTQVVKNNLNPVFDETFEFAVNQSDARQRTLDVAVKNSVGMFSKSQTQMGRVFINLSDIDLTKATTEWYNLQDANMNKSNRLESSL